MIIEGKTFQITANDLAPLNLELIDNDASGELTVGDQIKPRLSDEDLMTEVQVTPDSLSSWENLEVLLETGGKEVEIVAGENRQYEPQQSYALYGQKEKLEGLITLGQSCDLHQRKDFIEPANTGNGWVKSRLRDIQARRYTSLLASYEFFDAPKLTPTKKANKALTQLVGALKLYDQWQDNVAEFKEIEAKTMGSGADMSDDPITAQDIKMLLDHDRYLDQSVEAYIDSFE